MRTWLNELEPRESIGSAGGYLGTNLFSAMMRMSQGAQRGAQRAFSHEERATEIFEAAATSMLLHVDPGRRD